MKDSKEKEWRVEIGGIGMRTSRTGGERSEIGRQGEEKGQRKGRLERARNSGRERDGGGEKRTT